MNIDTIRAAVTKAWQTWDIKRPIVAKWAPFHDIAPPAYIGAKCALSYERRVELANAPTDGDGSICYVFAFGAYGETYVAAWGSRRTRARRDARASRRARAGDI